MKLPLNCSVDYIKDFLSSEEATELYRILIEEYQLDQARLIVKNGEKMMATDSFKILFATEKLIQAESHPESIHGKNFAWSGLMLTLRKRVEKLTGKEFEIAMCLYYPNGNYFAPYHYDQETSGYQTILPSISLGEIREFRFKSRTDEAVYSLDLAHGSLLLMADYCQSRYKHSLPKNPNYKNGRINITFRESDFK